MYCNMFCLVTLAALVLAVCDRDVHADGKYAHAEAVDGSVLMQTSHTTAGGVKQIVEDPFGDLEDEFDESRVMIDNVGFKETAPPGVQDNRFWSLFSVDILFLMGILCFSHAVYTRAKAPECVKAPRVDVMAPNAAEPPAASMSGPAAVDFQPLMHALQSGDEARWRQQLEELPSAATSEDVCGCTALHIAAHCGSVALTQELLDRGADASATEAWEETPLHFAAKAGSVDVCRMLLSHGVALNAVDLSGCTPLLAAGSAGHEAVCEFLLDQGATCGGADELDVPPLLSTLLLCRVVAGQPQVSS